MAGKIRYDHRAVGKYFQTIQILEMSTLQNQGRVGNLMTQCFLQEGIYALQCRSEPRLPIPVVMDGAA